MSRWSAALLILSLFVLTLVCEFQARVIRQQGDLVAILWSDCK